MMLGHVHFFEQMFLKNSHLVALLEAVYTSHTEQHLDSVSHNSN